MAAVTDTSSTFSLDRVLQGIEAEAWDAMLAREQSTFDELAGPFAGRLVLFGAGALGRSALAGLRQAGVEPLAFADNNHRLWGHTVDGLPLLSPEAAAKQYGDSACFVVMIYNGTSSRRQLAALGCRKVAGFTPLFWKYASMFIPASCVALPHHLRGHFEAIRECGSILHDDLSRQELCGQLAWRYWLDSTLQPPALDPAHIYFPFDLLSPLEDEVFVDCGSYNADTIRGFVSHWGGRFRHAFAMEPDPANLARLNANLRALKPAVQSKVSVLPFAAGNQNATVGFDATGSVSSRMSGADSAGQVECRRLSDLEWPVPPTYIKMDIEGAELEALRGAAELLQRHHPVLAVCTYHRGTHLWEIPNLIRSISPEYRLFLRRYAEESWKGVAYAIPSGRLKQ